MEFRVLLNFLYANTCIMEFLTKFDILHTVILYSQNLKVHWDIPLKMADLKMPIATMGHLLLGAVLTAKIIIINTRYCSR